MRILVVEDEKHLNRIISEAVEDEGYSVDSCFNGQEALEFMECAKYDVMILDIMMPKLNGLDLVRRLRRDGDTTPVLFLTARDSVADRVEGLESGGDYYLVKPFDVAELLARVETVLRRFHKTEETLSLAGVRVDPRARKVWRGEEEVSLTPKEYDLLLLFLHNPNAALYRDTIYERVWGGELAYGSKTVDLHVQRLRKKVGWEKALQAVNKIGYRLETPL